MAPRNRKNSALQAKIARLRLPLAPLVPMPAGPAHHAFPQTMLAYLILTEEQLDGLAHYYHQSTPGIWTEMYPIPVLWPRRLRCSSSCSVALAGSGQNDMAGDDEEEGPGRRASAPSAPCAGDRDRALATSTNPSRTGKGQRAPGAPQLDPILPTSDGTRPPKGGAQSHQRRWSAMMRNDAQRVAIKRRKFGKFIGLRGMDTPLDEVEARVWHDLERSIGALRRERRRERQREEGVRKMR